MCRDTIGLLRLVSLPIKKDLKVVVGLQNRYKKSYVELISQIHNGAIGDITSLDVYYNVGAPTIHPRQPGQTEMEYQMRNWRYFTWLWGGQLAGQTIHQIDVINWLMEDYPVTAMGLGGRQVFQGPNQGNTYDHHYVEFEYQNGVKLHVQSRNINKCWNRMGFNIQGTKGTADEKSRIFDNERNISWRHDEKNDPNPYQYEHDVFMDSILNGKKINDTEFGAKSTLTTIMGRMAMHSGQVMKLDEVMKSERNILPEKWAWDARMPDMPDESGNYPVPMPEYPRLYRHFYSMNRTVTEDNHRAWFAWSMIFMVVWCTSCTSDSQPLEVFTVTESAGITRELEYVEVEISLPVSDGSEQTISIREKDKTDLIEGQLIGLKNQTGGKNVAKYLFPVSIGANQSKTYQVVSGKGTSPLDSLKVEGIDFNLKVENEVFIADLTDVKATPENQLGSGQLAGLTLKQFDNQLLERTHINMHWSPNFQREGQNYKNVRPHEGRFPAY